MLLRNAAPGDVPALEALCRSSIGLIYGGILPPEVIAEWVEGDIVRETLAAQWPEMTVALQGDALGGVVRVEDGDRVDLLWVDPAQHRRGIGAALLRHAEERIFIAHPVAWLTVFRENRNARAFYRRMGWHETTRFVDENGVDVVRMEKRRPPRADRGGS